MAQLEKDIAKLLEENGITWQDNRRLAEGIKDLATRTSLQGVKESILNTDRIKQAVECPVCEQNIKVHPVSLNKTLCELLIKACKIDAGGQKYFHVQDDLDVPLSVGGGWAKLRHWDLIEPQPNPSDPTKAIQGMWCVTVKAMEFIGQKITLPSKVYLYNSRLISKHREQVSVVDVIGDFEEYKELMRFNPPSEQYEKPDIG